MAVLLPIPSPRAPTWALAAMAALALAACGQQTLSNRPPEAGDKAAARVAGETIWASDVKRQAVSQGLIGEGEPLDVSSDLFRRALNEVIDQKLLAKEALRLKLQREPVAQRRLAAAYDRVLGDILIESVVDRAVNENAVRALYQDQQKLSAQSEELSARQIVVPSQADADAIKKLLDTGASFETLALQRSTDQATRFNGGELGYFTLDAMPDPYKAALATAQKGQLVGPFKIDTGFALVKVEDRRPEQPISLEEARPQILRFLTYDQIRATLDRLRQGSKVEVLLSRPATPGGQPREPASAPPAGAAPPSAGAEGATEGGAAVTAPAAAPSVSPKPAAKPNGAGLKSVAH
ncbi:MAG TPA: peptidyl-prolyl cis-trans isomerase [Caulobacteraceae bacterium]|jgi:peptidyl-prolyl cis-trans isomerase C|nr:peptidyl-prolyl cis-trans isomerase [Caulobacteraceae bacterium]